MSQLLSLPTELIEEILLSPLLSPRDLCRASETCWLLHRITARLWTKVAHDRWKEWYSCVASSHGEWKSLAVQRWLCERHVHSAIESLSSKGYRLFLLDDADLDVFSAELPRSPLYSWPVVDCVLSDIQNAPLCRADLTNQFYGLYAWEHLVRRELKEKWENLLKDTSDQQILEKGAVLFSQWMNPLDGSITLEAVQGQLDSIAELVASELLQDDSRSTRLATTLPYPDLFEKLGTPVLRILDALNAVLYDRLKFKPATPVNYYQVENSFINQVLKRRTGIPLSMSVIYQSIARRLGVSLMPVNFPSHFMLKLQEDRQQTTPQDPVLIDAFNRGQRRTPQQCLDLIMTFDPSIASQEIFSRDTNVNDVLLRMVANMFGSYQHSTYEIERYYDNQTGKWGSIYFSSSLSLQLFLCSMMSSTNSVRENVAYCSVVCIETGYNLEVVERTLTDKMRTQPGMSTTGLNSLFERAKEQLERRNELIGTPPKVKKRNDGLLYRVGMIMKHRRYDYVCVIYGWDHVCEMSRAWIQQMGVDSLPRGKNQPFYNVLVMDGTNRYAAQESLEHCPQPALSHVTHWEVGKYFSSFTGRRYLPNDALRQVYPEDL